MLILSKSQHAFSQMHQVLQIAVYMNRTPLLHTPVIYTLKRELTVNEEVG